MKINLSNVKTEFPAITLGIADTPEEKLKVYQFRYHIYAEEMSKQFPNMDHRNKLLFDELDEWAIIIYAKVEADIIGTLRINIGNIHNFPSFWQKALDLEKFLAFQREPSLFAYTSKFMVASDYRNSAVSYLLSARSYAAYCTHQVQFSFGVCNFHLLRLYEQFGFRRYGRNFIDQGYGLLAPYVLLVDDLSHLRAVRSPFYRSARKRNVINLQAAEWFHKTFKENTVHINSQLISQEDLWQHLQQKLSAAPNQSIPILQGLSTIEAMKFLHSCSIIVKCYAGDQIVCEGDTNYALNILINGHLTRTNPSYNSEKTIAAGQTIGGNGLINHPKHTENVFAVTDAEVLVLSSLAFPKFHHTHPTIAQKVLYNITKNKDTPHIS
ncbi:GNAT family N-acyltransferase [Anaerosinus massiliensis]|uniref:GNAT family N-acyltransferase n=1 Tax=Massilibacillus massiliensis TaxID=1806837 RepID=UPI000AE6226F|nr:GNAT family N-acyltransferase [Massilibacillus massiliensis]